MAKKNNDHSSDRRPPFGLRSSAGRTKFARQEVIIPRKTILEFAALVGRQRRQRQVDIANNQIEITFADIVDFEISQAEFPDFNRVIHGYKTASL